MSLKLGYSLLIHDDTSTLPVMAEMSIRNLTKVPKLSLVYFSVDQSTCVVETKKLRRKDTGESYTECPPEKMDAVTIRSGSKQLEALVIASDGRSLNSN